MNPLNNKFDQLESFRGILALCVSLIHVQFAISILTNNFIIKAGGGDWPVDFFFVLSGFVISYAYGNKVKSRATFYVFIRKRFWRLYPLHLLTLLIFVFIEAARYIVEFYYPGTIIRPGFEGSDYSAFISNLFLFHAFTGDIGSFNGPSWSISVEFYTYFLFGIVALLFKNRLFIYIILIIFSFLRIFLFETDLIFTSELFFSRCIYGFSLGVVACYFVNRYKINSKYGVLLFYLTGLLFLCIMYFPVTKFVAVIPQVLFAVSIYALIFINKRSSLYKLMTNRFFVYLGKISYSIYMWHIVVWIVVGNFLRFIVGNHGELIDGMRFMFWPWYISLLITFIALLLLIMVGSISYKFIELPFLNKNHKSK
ncbi:acyltransferase [Alphaproteobacteria bacterium]|nr:acyltransferase [Alphaproteobacteria bacterium]